MNKKTKANTSRYEFGKNAVPIFSIKPIVIPPVAAKGIELKPPITDETKAFKNRISFR